MYKPDDLQKLVGQYEEKLEHFFQEGGPGRDEQIRTYDMQDSSWSFDLKEVDDQVEAKNGLRSWKSAVEQYASRHGWRIVTFGWETSNGENWRIILKPA